jgi:hypothetical protein
MRDLGSRYGAMRCQVAASPSTVSVIVAGRPSIGMRDARVPGCEATTEPPSGAHKAKVVMRV